MIIKEVKQKTKYACNCVLYARTWVPDLPYGLWTLWQKKKIMNARLPRKGAVAVMKCGFPWGHVGVVIGWNRKKNKIRIKEANWRRCKLTIRYGTPEELKIVGYYVGKSRKVR